MEGEKLGEEEEINSDNETSSNEMPSPLEDVEESSPNWTTSVKTLSNSVCQTVGNLLIKNNLKILKNEEENSNYFSQQLIFNRNHFHEYFDTQAYLKVFN